LRQHREGAARVGGRAARRGVGWPPPSWGGGRAAGRPETRRPKTDAARARRDTQAAGTEKARQRLTDRAAAFARWEQMTRGLETKLTQAQAGYDAWERATAPTRERAVAADAELRRRHPDRHIEPLRAPREPEPAAAAASAQPAAGEPERQPAAPGPEPAKPDLAPAVGKLDQVADRLRQLNAALDAAILRQAREAEEQAARTPPIHYQPKPS